MPLLHLHLLVIPHVMPSAEEEVLVGEAQDRSSSQEPLQPRSYSAPTHVQCKRCLAVGLSMLNTPPGEESNKHSLSPGNAASCTRLL